MGLQTLHDGTARKHPAAAERIQAKCLCQAANTDHIGVAFDIQTYRIDACIILIDLIDKEQDIPVLQRLCQGGKNLCRHRDAARIVQVAENDHPRGWRERLKDLIDDDFKVRSFAVEKSELQPCIQGAVRKYIKTGMLNEHRVSR